MRGTPNEWASRAIGLYVEWNADRIVAEVNQGGDLVEPCALSTAFNAVRATRGKFVRHKSGRMRRQRRDTPDPQTLPLSIAGPV
jgi:phage terminase large subunit-like protein